MKAALCPARRRGRAEAVSFSHFQWELEAHYAEQQRMSIMRCCRVVQVELLETAASAAAICHSNSNINSSSSHSSSNSNV